MPLNKADQTYISRRYGATAARHGASHDPRAQRSQSFFWRRAVIGAVEKCEV